MFKDYLKAWFNYRNDKNFMSLKTLSALKTEIQQDLFDAFEMGEPVIREHPDLFDTSSSFVDFLFRLLDVSPPKHSFVKKDSDSSTTTTIQGKLDNINASLNEIMMEHKRLIGEVDKTYKTNKEAFVKGEEVLTANLGKLSSIVAEFNEHFQIIKRMSDNLKQKFQDNAIEYAEETSGIKSLGDSSQIKPVILPLSNSDTDSAEHETLLSKFETCEKDLIKKQAEYDQLKKEFDKNKISIEELQKDSEIILNMLSFPTPMNNLTIQTNMFKPIQQKILELQEQHKKDSETKLEKIASLENKLDAVKQELKTTTNQLKNLDVKMENDDDRFELQNKISELEKEIKNKQAEKDEFVSENQKLKKEISDIRSEFETQIQNKLTEKDNVVKETEILKNEIRTLQNNIYQKDETINQLQNEIGLKNLKFENEMSVLKAEHHSADAGEFTESLRNINEKLRTELEQLKTENGKLNFNYESLQRKLTDVQSSWEKRERENRNLSNEMDTMRQEIFAKERIISELNNLLTTIKNYVDGSGIKMESLQSPDWINKWIENDKHYHRYVDALQKMLKKLFPHAIIEDFTHNNIITEEKVNSNIKTYETLIESQSQTNVFLSSQVALLKAELEKFQMFNSSVDDFMKTKRHTFDRESNQIERSRRERSRSPNRPLSSQQKTDTDDVEFIDLSGSQIQNMDDVKESIQKIYEEHEEMTNFMNIMLKQYQNTLDYQTEIRDYQNNIQQKIETGTDSQYYLNNIVAILDLHLNNLETIANLNTKYGKCSSILCSFTPHENTIKTDQDEITTENDQMDQTQAFLQNLVNDHSEILWFINLFEKYTTEDLITNRKNINDIRRENNEERVNLYLKIIDNYLKYEILVKKLTDEINAINNIYTLQGLIYDSETQNLVLSEPIITEIARLRSESEQRLTEINDTLLPKIKSCKKRIGTLKKRNLELNKYRTFFLRVKKDLHLKDPTLIKQKEYQNVINKIFDMINIYNQIESQVGKLRQELPHLKNLSVNNFTQTFENIYQSLKQTDVSSIQKLYAKYILKILSFQQNLPILNFSTVCVSCKNTIDIGSQPYRFGCHENHIFHNSCLEIILETNLTCPECQVELFPDMNYFESTKKRSMVSSPNKRGRYEYMQEFEDELAEKDEMIKELKFQVEYCKEKLNYQDDSATFSKELTDFEVSGDDRSAAIQQRATESVNQKWINIIYLLSVMYYEIYKDSRTERKLLVKDKEDEIIENLQNLQQRVIRAQFENFNILSILFDFFVKHAQIITNRPIDLLENADTVFKSEKEVVDYIISNLHQYYNTK